jgi:hypothetical protein
MKALIINCTLKPSPEASNTRALADVVRNALRGHGVEVSTVRAVDHDIMPGVESDRGAATRGRGSAPRSWTARF